MGLVGNLKDLNITNIIELNCVEKSTAQVTIKTRTGDAIIFFDDGEIVHARWGELKGVEALYRILRLSDGAFRVTSDIAPPERTIFESWKGLLLDGMRVYDETERLKGRIVTDLADELRSFPGVSRLLVAAKNGTVVHEQGPVEPDRTYAISAFLTEQAAALSDELHLGPLDYAATVRGDEKEFVFDCDPFLVALSVPRAADIRPTGILIERIREKLKSSEAPPPERPQRAGRAGP
jgi:predicted regulator of Ras-like GTPase activity (Roadblock/LC7/MglB family)